MPDLDIVIPVYNEGGNILKVLNALCDATRTPFRVLICYDDESDDTLDALKDFNDARCEIVRVRNRGRGAHGAVVTGFEEGDAPAAIMWPADDSFNAPIIDAMYREYLNGCHVVCASRFIRGGCMVGAPWLKSLLVRSSAFTLYYLARLPARDASNGLRLFSRRLLDRAKDRILRGFRLRDRTAGQMPPAGMEHRGRPRGVVRKDLRQKPLQSHPLAAGIPALVFLRFRNHVSWTGVPKPYPKRGTRIPDMNPGDQT